jgi:uncharacterized protein YbbK (DUF523 family)
VKIAVSACLLGVKCRYDGKAKPCKAVEDFLSTTVAPEDIVRICPEVAGGLSIPHAPNEIQTGKLPEVEVIDSNGVNNTEAFQAGAARCLQRAQSAGCTHAILKAKSPSCGVGEIYDGSFTKTLTSGNGLAAQALLDAGLVVATEENFLEVFSAQGGADSTCAAERNGRG